MIIRTPQQAEEAFNELLDVIRRWQEKHEFRTKEYIKMIDIQDTPKWKEPAP